MDEPDHKERTTAETLKLGDSHSLPMASEHEAKRMKVEKTQKDSLDSKQSEILDLCKNGKNLFITGVGGISITSVSLFFIF